jgi:fructokinase
MKNANSTVLIGKPFKEDVQQRLARSIRTTNDANCFVLSEAIDGAAAGCAVAFGVILGTGVGGGIAVHGRILEGPNAIAGEWGHNPLPWPSAAELPGPQCYCGKHGCIETFLCGPALSRQYEQLCGSALAPTEIAEQASLRNDAAAAALTLYEDRLARALASVINILDPDAIVIGGGVSNIASLYDALPPRLARYVFSDGVRTKIVKAVHGDSSGVRGAAMLWP